MNPIRALKFGIGKRLPVILQTEGSECSLACVAMVVSYHGHETDLSELRKRFSISLKGATLEHVINITDELGMSSRPLQLELEELDQLQLPAILHWNLNHMVVLKAIKGNWVHIHDPAIGALRLSFKQVSEHFTGVALELTPGLTFRRKAAPAAIELRHLMGRVVGLKRGLLQLLGLAVVLETFAIVMPIITQWITDEAIVGGDRDLLTMLGLGMVAMGVFNALMGGVRSWIGIYISTHFNLQWMANVMGRLLKLPVEYFERRHLGDIVSRFGAVRTIEHSLTSASIEALLDGLLVIGTLAMMLIYAPTLTAVSAVAVLLYAVFRAIRYDTEKMAATGVIAKQAKEQTYFLETIRGVRSIKMYNRENERRAAWLNLWVDATNAGLVTQKLALYFGTGWSLISSVERACIFWMGAAMVIDHRLSLGMLFAFLSYKEQFSGRVNRLIDRFIEFKMLSISMQRLGDIVLSAPEERVRTHRREVPDDLTITLDKLDFRYGVDEALILNGASLRIKPGECIAITGPSGCGKTTLLKIMLGILKPAKGKMLLGDCTIDQLGLRNYRSVAATVMQDDHLFAGSVSDNICFLDPKPDLDWMKQCARAACIHDEIAHMPMGFHTLVGDMGAALSGGQKQRILLARALYKRPKILFLDEATSHLDVENETRIGEAIRALAITRIMIAHRPQTIAIADRVFVLEGGKLFELQAAPPSATDALAQEGGASSAHAQHGLPEDALA
ncbi:MAG: peptidase domain-containing ABC transporter [Pseudomonadota bacterium]